MDMTRNQSDEFVARGTFIAHIFRLGLLSPMWMQTHMPSLPNRTGVPTGRMGSACGKKGGMRCFLQNRLQEPLAG